MIQTLPSPSGQVMLQISSIYRVTLQNNLVCVFQQKCILSSVPSNNIRSDPHRVELSMLVFVRSIPLQNQVINLKLLFLDPSVKSILHLLLMRLHFVISFTSSFFELDDLIYPPLYVIWFFLLILEISHNWYP